MARKRIMGIDVNYEFSNINSDTTIILLHGWGQNIEMMIPIKDVFKTEFNVLIIDFPGFGKSQEPTFSWTVYDYTECLRKLVKYLKLNKIILIGHSFGGKVSLVYASRYKTEKLVCLASPYCKELNKLPLKNRIYKKLKNIKCLRWLSKILQNYVGSEDYKNASPIMRGVLVKTINQDLSDDIKKIKCPTLLIWGSLDTAVPLKRAYEIEKMIKDSAVIVYEGATHYAYLERLNQISIVLKSFFNKGGV